MSGELEQRDRLRLLIERAVAPVDSHQSGLIAGLVLAVGFAAVSLLALLSPPPPPVIPALLYLAVLGFAAAIGGRGPGFVGVVLGSLAFDFFFLPPLHHLWPGRVETLGVGRAPGIVAIIVFFLVALGEVEFVARQRLTTQRARVLGNQMAVLASVSDLLSQSFDYEKTLEEVAHLAATAFEGVCLIDLLEEDGSANRVAAAGSNPRESSLAQQLRKFPPDLSSPGHPLARVLRTGRPELVGNVDPAFLGAIARNEEHAKIHRELRPASAIMAPLIARERTVGALVLASPVAGRYGGSDLDVAEDLAARVALAVDNARLFQAEGRARDEALVSLEQTQQLHSVATALGQALTRSAVAEVMVVQACSALQAERATIAELVDEGRTFEILAFRGYPEDLMARWGRFSAEVPSPMADAVKLRQPVIVDSHQELVSRWPELADPDRPSAGQANVTVPLVLDSRVLGALSIGFRESRQLEMSDLAFIGTLGRQCALALERARLLEAEQTARREAETVAARLMLVSRTSELLAVSLDYPATFVRLAKLMVESLADLCLIDVRQDEGTISRVAAVHANPEQQALADVLRERYAPSPNGAHPVAIVMETGEPQYSPEMSEEFLRATTYDEEHFRIVAALGFQSFMCLPLAARGRILGAITFVSTNPERRYSEGDLNAAREIARRAAVRIDNARLFQAEQRARVEAETAQGRLQFLAEASRILSSSLDYDLTLSRVTSLVVPRMADWCNVQLVDEAGQIRTLALAHADPEKVELARQLQAEYPPDPDAPTGTPHVIRTGKSELSREIPDALLAELIRDPRLLEIVRGLGLRSSMVVPLAARGRVFGAIAFIAAESGRLYDAQDLELAEELGRRAGVAIDNARLYRERDYVAQTLQRSLLPPRLPDIRGVELEARYYPLLAASEVGGDFYDVFELGAGAWTLAIGDVCGKGPDAAAVMAVARYTLRAAAMHEGRPSGVLRTMNEVLLGQVSDQRFCTACCARLRLDEGRGRLTICSGGHPLPILVRANGEATTVGKAGTLLGVLSDLSLTDVAVDLAAGDALVLYTDGLLDERHGGASGGETKLIAVLAEHAGQEARRMAQALDEYLVRTHGDSPRDDAAFLIARVTP